MQIKELENPCTFSNAVSLIIGKNNHYVVINNIVCNYSVGYLFFGIVIYLLVLKGHCITTYRNTVGHKVSQNYRPERAMLLRMIGNDFPLPLQGGCLNELFPPRCGGLLGIAPLGRRKNTTLVPKL
jgi:hypothetical protein